MKTILLILSLLISSNVFADEYMILPIVKVYDGDTIQTTLSHRLPAPLNKVSIRIRGIDTPEMPAKSYKKTGKLGRAKCVQEAELALKAKARVQEIAKFHKKMRITDFEWGKFGSRIIANVTIHGVDIRKTLLKEGLAVEYFGKGAKKDWCQ